MSSSKIVYLLSVLILLSKATSLTAQNYQAIHGSSQAGGMSGFTNPSSILHIPFAWDITPVAVGVKQATNILSVKNYSLLSLGVDTLQVEATTGTMKRFAFFNQDISLFNTRIRLDNRQALAFGMNIRSYASVVTSSFNWQDSLPSLRAFMSVNSSNIPFGGEMRGSSWIEVFGTYARNLIDNNTAILNGGLTFKVTRGLGAGYVNAGDMNYAQAGAGPADGFVLQSAELQYGYSMNFDDVDGHARFRDQVRQFLHRSYASISASAGIEYILPAIIEGEEENGYSYDLKVGISVLDIGSNKFMHSNRSRAVVFNRDNIPDTTLQSSFENVRNIDELNDSLAVVTASAVTVSGLFKVHQPTRLLVNVDKHIINHFFINGEFCVSLRKLVAADNLYVRDMNFVALTPRYETKTTGFYLPITFNAERQFWIGGAFKSGPLLLGVHNWANLFSKKKIHNGGVYLALTFRPGKNHENSSRTPQTRLSRRQRRMLECPRL